MAASRTPQGPLDWRVPITNDDGTPTAEFMRKWNLQVGINTGIPTTPQQLSQILDLLGATQGDVLFRAASGWQVLAPGAAHALLTSGGSGNNPAWATLSAELDVLGDAEGSVLYRGAAGWAVLAPGTAGEVLTTEGAGAAPIWAASGGGSVTSHFGSGAPVTLHTDGDLYFDTSATPYAEYVQNAGAWVAVAGGGGGGGSTTQYIGGPFGSGVNTTGAATKGNFFEPIVPLAISKVFVQQGVVTAGHTLRCSIVQLDAFTGGVRTITNVLGTATALTTGAEFVVTFSFAAPVVLAANTPYCVLVTDTSAALATTSLVMYNAQSLASWINLPCAFLAGSSAPGVYSVTIATLNPTVGTTFTPSMGAGLVMAMEAGVGGAIPSGSSAAYIAAVDSIGT